MRNTKLILALLGGTVSVLGITPALAQDAPATAAAPAPDPLAPVDQNDATAAEQSTGSTDIVVTAQRRSERLVDVPVSINSATNEQLETAGIMNVSDLPRLAPGVTFSKNGAYQEFAIRGVTTKSPENSVAVYVDGVYNPSKVSIELGLANVERVDVLKGPQGTLFGRNVTGGAVLITTRTPSQEMVLEARAGLEERGGRSASLYLAGGIANNLAADISLAYSADNGWIKAGAGAPFPEGTDMAPRYFKSGRSKLVWTPSNAFTATATLEFGDVDAPTGLNKTQVRHSPIAIPVERNKVFLNRIALNRARWTQPTLKLEYAADNFTITSLSSYRYEDSDFRSDADGLPAVLADAGWDDIAKTLSQELTFNSRGWDRLDLVAGLFYYRSDFDKGFFVNNNGQLATQLTTSVAAFADGTYEVVPSLFLTAGLRFSYEKKDLDYQRPRNSPTVSFSDSVDYNNLSPRAVIRYEIDGGSNIYASFSQGFKSGYFNQAALGLTGPNDPRIQPLDPERLTAFEVGYKATRNRWSLSTAAYYYTYKDIQVSSFDGTTLVDQNAAAAEIYGVEGQLSYKLTDYLNVSVNGAYTHARYTDFANFGAYLPTDPSNPNSPLSLSLQDLSGARLLRTPDFSGNFSADYTLPTSIGDFTLSGNVYHASSSAPGNPQVDRGTTQQNRVTGPITLVNMNLAWQPTENFQLQVYARNLLDKVYFSELDATALGYSALWAEPQTFGVRMAYKY